MITHKGELGKCQLLVPLPFGSLLSQCLKIRGFMVVRIGEILANEVDCYMEHDMAREVEMSIQTIGL